MTDVFDGLFQAQPDLRFLDLELVGLVAEVALLLLGLGPFRAQRVQPPAGSTGSLRLLASAFAKPFRQRFHRVGSSRETRRDLVDGGALRVELRPACAGLGLLVGPCREAAVDLGEPCREQRAAFLDRCRLHVEVAPQREGAGASAVRISASRLRLLVPALGLGKTRTRVGLDLRERGELTLELGHLPCERRVPLGK